MRADDSPLLAPSRLVLIGTPETVRAAAAALATLPNPPEALGAVLLHRAGPEAEASLPATLPVLGELDNLPRLRQRFDFDLALVSLPAVMTEAIAQVRASLRTMGVTERFFPAISDVLTATATHMNLVTGASALAAATDMLELVGRRPHPIDEQRARRTIAGKRVLITGAGGSIGAELARRVAALEPALLVLMDRSDNALFEIDRQVSARFPRIPRQGVLHDVVEAEPTLRRLVALRPDVVFHAAAHKHVPMMEDHPAQAVNNNLFGTRSIADAAVAVGAERFVMISTDKAVRPTSVMGATKALAEMYVRALNRAPRPGARQTRLCMVRFGNVLGSACSVLPIWEKQIAEGGPVTVTDPRMTRFFMTIPEAAALVIQAASLSPEQAGDADVFVLDMGDPVSILDLARRFVAAHGLSPRVQTMPSTDAAGGAPRAGSEIEVVFTGARPGEKLHEELVHEPSELRPTPAPGVMAWTGPAADPALVTEMVADLSSVRTSSHDRAVVEAIAQWIPDLSKQGVHPIDRARLSGAA